MVVTAPLPRQTYTIITPPDPALLPPKGVAPDFQDPYSLQPYHTLTAIATLILTTGFVALKLYTKKFVKRELQWEDYMLFLGWAGLTSFIGIQFVVMSHGGGRHQWNIIYHSYSEQLRFSNLMDILYGPSILTIKLSILGLVLRLFCINGSAEWFWWVIQTLNILNTLFYTTHFLLPFFVCSPRHKIWDPRLPGTCIKVFNLYITSAALNVVSDVAMFLIPLYRIFTLRVSLRKRMGVGAVFSIGFFAVVSSIVRLILGFKLANTEDYSYVKVQTVMWCYGELGFGIIVSCMPLMPMLWKYWQQGRVTDVRERTIDVESVRHSAATGSSRKGSVYGNGGGSSNSRGSPPQFRREERALSGLHQQQQGGRGLGRRDTGLAFGQEEGAGDWTPLTERGQGDKGVGSAGKTARQQYLERDLMRVSQFEVGDEEEMEREGRRVRLSRDPWSVR